jgi:hypothetical protein
MNAVTMGVMWMALRCSGTNLHVCAYMYICPAHSKHILHLLIYAAVTVLRKLSTTHWRPRKS